MFLLLIAALLLVQELNAAESMYVVTVLNVENIADIDEVGKTMTLDIELTVNWPVDPTLIPKQNKYEYHSIFSSAAALNLFLQ